SLAVLKTMESLGYVPSEENISDDDGDTIISFISDYAKDGMKKEILYLDKIAGNNYWRECNKLEQKRGRCSRRAVKNREILDTILLRSEITEVVREKLVK